MTNLTPALVDPGWKDGQSLITINTLLMQESLHPKIKVNQRILKQKITLFIILIQFWAILLLQTVCYWEGNISKNSANRLYALSFNGFLVSTLIPITHCKHDTLLSSLLFCSLLLIPYTLQEFMFSIQILLLYTMGFLQKKLKGIETGKKKKRVEWSNFGEGSLKVEREMWRRGETNFAS